MKLREIIRLPKHLLWALVMEGVETTQMLKTFARHGSGKLRLTPAHRHKSLFRSRQGLGGKRLFGRIFSTEVE